MATRPTVEINVKIRELCPHSEKERIEAAKVRGICPLCFVDDLRDKIGKNIREGIHGPKIPSPTELGLPLYPWPPCVDRWEGFLGCGIETKESKLRRARYAGASEMWQKFMDALYPKK